MFVAVCDCCERIQNMLLQAKNVPCLCRSCTFKYEDVQGPMNKSNDFEFVFQYTESLSENATILVYESKCLTVCRNKPRPLNEQACIFIQSYMNLEANHINFNFRCFKKNCNLTIGILAKLILIIQ